MFTTRFELSLSMKQIALSLQWVKRHYLSSKLIIVNPNLSSSESHHVQIFTKFAVWTLIFTFHAGDMNCCSTDVVTAINFCLILLTK